jgi:hypothetical protein
MISACSLDRPAFHKRGIRSSYVEIYQTKVITMTVAYIVLLIGFFVLFIITYHNLTNKKSKLGSIIFSDSSIIENELLKFKATGRDCLEYLKKTISCKPFKLIERKNKSGGGSFSLFGRIMVVKTDIDKPCYESIRTVAHEYAHACQVGQHWTLFFYFLCLSYGLFLLIAFLLILQPSNPLIFVLILFSIILYFIGHTTKEVDAIFRSIFFVELYLKNKGLNQDKLTALINHMKCQSSASLIWYIISDIESQVLLYLLLLTAASLLRPTILHILAKLCPQ